MKQYNNMHMVNMSPWPICLSMSLMVSTMNGVILFQYKESVLLWSGLLLTIIFSIQWWRDVIREATFQGGHSKFISNSLRLGFLLFISTEVMFFFSFFWSFFHVSLSINLNSGSTWPPIGILPFNQFEIPLLNTLILLSSGITLTWSHFALSKEDKKEAILGMTITISLGLIFTGLQYFEYLMSGFTFTDSSYGSSFFLMTGFHGMHVVVGSLFLLINLLRLYTSQVSNIHHLSYEMAAWYWHFVDVVWLFLYLTIYSWGS